MAGKVASAVLWFLAVAGVEVFNTRTRTWTVERLQLNAAGWVVGAMLLRLALTSGLLVLAFRHAVSSGVAALMGYLCCRWVMVWWVHRRYAGEDDTEQPS